MAMEGHDELVVVALTWDEAHELFARCLKSLEEDTPASSSALQKLATAVGSTHEPAPYMPISA